MDPHLAEDEQLQKIKDWWKSNGSSIIVGIIVGLGAIVGVNGWEWYTDKQAKTASTIYAQLRQSVDGQDAGTAGELARELQEDFSSTPYAASGALLAARARYEAGEMDAARELLGWVIDNADNDNLAHAARVRLAYLELGEGNSQKALDLASVDAPGEYASHYAEIRADAARAAGDLEAARAAYDEAIAALTPGSNYANVLSAKKNSISVPE